MTIKKLISLLTLTSFLVNFVFNQTLKASLDTPKALKQEKSLEDFIIPQGYGRVTESKMYGSKQVVVNIQDLHCHSEVQRNISGILSVLDTKYVLKNVYVEGGYGKISTSWICDVKDEAIKKQIINNLVEQGRLTGSEYYSAISNKPDLLRGIEDEAIHKANIVRLGKIIEKREYFEGELKGLDKELEYMKARYFNTRNRSFSRLVERHKAGEIDALKYYSLLNGYIKKINENPRENKGLTIKMEDYPDIRVYMEMGQIGKQLNYNRITRQLEQFVGTLRSKIPYSEYANLIEKTDNFSKAGELYIRLAQVTKEYKLDIEHKYADLNNFFEYTEKSGKLNPIALIQEEKRLTEDIRIGLSQDISELEVSFLADFYGYFKDYLLNKISADDYTYFKHRFSKFQSVWNRYTYESRMKELSNGFTLLNEFYECNCQRNDCFIRNMALEEPNAIPASNSSEKPLSEQLKNSEIVVVVTGGFHTEGLKGILRDKKISYIAITPNVSSGADDSYPLYVELARQQAKLFSSQTLALALSSAGAKIVEINKDAIVVEINGESIEIKPGKHKYKISDAIDTIKRQIEIGRKAIKLAESEFKKHVKAIKRLSNPLASSELIYGLIKAFAEYGAQKDLFGSNGIIFSIASNRNVQEAIEGNEHLTMQELSGFPAILQRITADKAIIKENLLEIAETPLQVAMIEAVNNPDICSKLLDAEKYKLQKFKNDALEELFTHSQFKIGSEITDADRLNGMIDLHMHDSDGSDGAVSVEEQIQNAVDAGVQVIQITNHDTVSSLARAEKKVNGLNRNRKFEDKIVLVPAVEIEVRNQDDKGVVRSAGIDLVASNIDIEKTAKILEKSFSADKARLLNQKRNDYIYGMIANGNFKIDFPAVNSALSDKGIKTLPSIGLSEEDFKIKPLSEIDLTELRQFLTIRKDNTPSKSRAAEGIIYRILPSDSFEKIRTKIKDNIGRGAGVYPALLGEKFTQTRGNAILTESLSNFEDKNEFMSVKKLISKIHKQGGKIILAHPMRYFGADMDPEVLNAVDEYNDNELNKFIEKQISVNGSSINKLCNLIEEYKGYGLDGISANYLYSGTASKNDNLNRVANIFVARYNFKYIPAGETDCHGPYLNSAENIVVGTAAGVPEKKALLDFKSKWYKAVTAQESLDRSKRLINKEDRSERPIVNAGGITAQAASPAGLAAEVEGEYTRPVNVSNKTLPLTLSAKSFDNNSQLAKAWREKAGNNYIYTRQINPVNPTYVGVSGDDKKLVSEFARVLVMAGFFSSEMMEMNLLFVIDGDNVKVFEGEKAKLRTDLAGQANTILEKARVSISRSEKESADKKEYLKRLDGIKFFIGKLPENTETVGFASGETAAGKFIAVYGKIDQRESQNLVEELNTRCPIALKKLGHVIVKFEDRGFVVESKAADDQALKEIRRFIEGFYTILNFSDVHLGSPYKFGGDKETELMNLLDKAIINRSLIVINGDFLDLWQEKYGKIKKAHQALFDKIKQARRVIYIAGNHDRAIHSDFLEGVKKEILETAKENVITFSSKAETLKQLADTSSIRKFIQGARIVLSKGFEGRVVYDNIENIFYVDESVLDIKGEPARHELYSRIRDSRENLNQKVQEDLKAEVVRYYFDAQRGLYFEHGHVTDGTSNKNPMAPAIVWVLGWISKHISGDIEYRITNLLQKLAEVAVKILPHMLLKETRNVSGRTIALAKKILQGLSEKGVGDRRINIFFAHIHVPVVFSGPVHDFLSHFTSSMGGYANDGAWASRRKQDNYLPELWHSRHNLMEKDPDEDDLNRSSNESGLIPALRDSLLITFENTVLLLRGCAYVAGNEENADSQLARPGNDRPIMEKQRSIADDWLNVDERQPEISTTLEKQSETLNAGTDTGTSKFQIQNIIKLALAIFLFLIPVQLYGASVIETAFNAFMGFIGSPAGGWVVVACGIGFLAYTLWEIYLGINSKGLESIPGLSLNETKTDEKVQKGNIPEYDGTPIEIVGSNKTLIEVIDKRDDLRNIIEQRLSPKQNKSVKTYLLHYFNNETNTETAGGLIEVFKESELLMVIVKRGVKTEKRAIPTLFMRDIIDKNKPGKVLFVFETEAGNKKKIPADEQLENIFSANTSFFMPKYSRVKMDAAEFAKMDKTVASYGTVPIGITYPRLVLMKENKLKFENKRLLYFKALEYNRLVLVSEIFWLIASFVNSLIFGMVLPTILKYAADIGVLNIYNLVMEIASAGIMVIVSTIASNRIVDVQMMRADMRTDVMRGHIWEKKIQNEKGVKRLSRYFLYLAFINTVNNFLFFMLIPASVYGNLALGAILFSFIPSVYLIVFIGQNIFTKVLESCQDHYLNEIMDGALLSNEDAIKKGFAKQNKNIDNYSHVIGTVLSVSGMLLGVGFLQLGMNNIVVPTIIAASIISIISGFIIPFFRNDNAIGLEFSTKNFLGAKNENELQVSKNIMLSFNPEDIRIRNVIPIAMSKNKSWLPWAKMLRTKIIYKVEPKIETLANRIIIRGSSTDPTITVKKRFGRLKTTKEMLHIEQADQSWIISFAAEYKNKDGSLFGIKIWRAVADALKLKLGIDNPLVREMFVYASGKAESVIAHDLAVKALVTLGRDIEPDVELTGMVLNDPLLNALKGKVVIDTMNSPPLDRSDNFDFKFVSYSKDRNGILHIILPKEFKEKYSDKILPAATLATIHEYLESTGKTHEEVISAGFGPEILNLPNEEFQDSIQQNLKRLEFAAKSSSSGEKPITVPRRGPPPQAKRQKKPLNRRGSDSNIGPKTKIDQKYKEKVLLVASSVLPAGHQFLEQIEQVMVSDKDYQHLEGLLTDKDLTDILGIENIVSFLKLNPDGIINTVPLMLSNKENLKNLIDLIGVEGFESLIKNNQYAFARAMNNIFISYTAFERLYNRYGNQLFINHPDKMDIITYNSEIINNSENIFGFLLDFDGIFDGKYIDDAKTLIKAVPAESKDMLEAPDKEIQLRKYLLAILILLRKNVPALVSEDLYKKIAEEIVFDSYYDPYQFGENAWSDFRIGEKLVTEAETGPNLIAVFAHELGHNLQNDSLIDDIQEFIANLSMITIFHELGWKKKLKKAEKYLDFEEGRQNKKSFPVIIHNVSEQHESATAELLWLKQMLPSIKNHYDALLNISLEISNKNQNINFRQFVQELIRRYRKEVLNDNDENLQALIGNILEMIKIKGDMVVLPVEIALLLSNKDDVEDNVNEFIKNIKTVFKRNRYFVKHLNEIEGLINEKLATERGEERAKQLDQKAYPDSEPEGVGQEYVSQSVPPDEDKSISITDGPGEAPDRVNATEASQIPVTVSMRAIEPAKKNGTPREQEDLSEFPEIARELDVVREFKNTREHFSFKTFSKKVRFLLYYNGKRKALVQQAVYSAVKKMSENVKKNSSVVLGLSGEISGLYEIIKEQGTTLKNISLGEPQTLNEVVRDGNENIVKEFDAVSDNTIFEFKFTLSLGKLYQQVIGTGPAKKAHLKILNDYRKYGKIRNIVYFGEWDGGYVAPAIKDFVKNNPSVLSKLDITDDGGVSLKLSLDESREFLFSKTTIKLARDEEKKWGRPRLPKDFENHKEYMNELINNKLKQINGEKFDVIIAISNVAQNDLNELRALQFGEHIAENTSLEKPYVSAHARHNENRELKNDIYIIPPVFTSFKYQDQIAILRQLMPEHSDPGSIDVKVSRNYGMLNDSSKDIISIDMASQGNSKTAVLYFHEAFFDGLTVLPVEKQEIILKQAVQYLLDKPNDTAELQEYVKEVKETRCNDNPWIRMHFSEGRVPEPGQNEAKKNILQSYKQMDIISLHKAINDALLGLGIEAYSPWSSELVFYSADNFNLIDLEKVSDVDLILKVKGFDGLSGSEQDKILESARDGLNKSNNTVNVIDSLGKQQTTKLSELLTGYPAFFDFYAASNVIEKSRRVIQDKLNLLYSGINSRKKMIYAVEIMSYLGFTNFYNYWRGRLVNTKDNEMDQLWHEFRAEKIMEIIELKSLSYDQKFSKDKEKNLSELIDKLYVSERSGLNYGSLFGAFDWSPLVEAAKDLLEKSGISIPENISYKFATKVLEVLGVSHVNDYDKEIKKAITFLNLSPKVLGPKQVHIIRGPPERIPNWDRTHEFVTFLKDEATGKLHIYVHADYLEKDVEPFTIHHSPFTKLLVAIAHEYRENELIKGGMSPEEAHRKVVKMGIAPELLNLQEKEIQKPARGEVIYETYIKGNNGFPVLDSTTHEEALKWIGANNFPKNSAVLNVDFHHDLENPDKSVEHINKGNWAGWLLGMKLAKSFWWLYPDMGNNGDKESFSKTLAGLNLPEKYDIKSDNTLSFTPEAGQGVILTIDLDYFICHSYPKGLLGQKEIKAAISRLTDVLSKKKYNILGLHLSHSPNFIIQDREIEEFTVNELARQLKEKNIADIVVDKRASAMVYENTEYVTFINSGDKAKGVLTEYYPAGCPRITQKGIYFSLLNNDILTAKVALKSIKELKNDPEITPLLVKKISEIIVDNKSKMDAETAQIFKQAFEFLSNSIYANNRQDGSITSGKSKTGLPITLAPNHIFSRFGLENDLVRKVMEAFSGKTAGDIKPDAKDILNEHYVTGAALDSAIKEFGSAVVNESGNVHTNIYLMDTMPENPEGLDLKNTGILVEGNPVWASTKEGALVLFAQGASAGAVAQAVEETVTGTKRGTKRFSEFFRAVNVEVGAKGFKPGIIVDHTSAGRNISYNEQGSMVVTSDLFIDKEGNINADAVSSKLNELMTIRNAESVAMPQNIYIKLDGLANIKEFMVNLEAFNKAGNGQMVVDPDIFSGLEESKIREIAELARKSGVRVCMDLRDDSSRRQYYMGLGFPGYILTVNNETKMYDFVAPETGIKADVISGYESVDQLKNRISGSHETCKILNLSEINGLLKGGERSIVDRVALTEILKTTLLSLYSTNTLTKEFVSDVGHAWDRDKLPAFPADTDVLTEACRNGNIDLMAEAMNIKGVSTAVNTYMEKLSNELNGSGNEQKLQELQKTFLIAIAEKMLAKAELNRAGKTNGLADQGMEIVLGEKLLERKMLQIEDMGLLITPEMFMLQNKVDTMTFYRRLDLKIKELSGSTDPMAINAIVALIPRLGEPRMVEQLKKKEVFFDENSIKEVLNAA